MSAADSVLSDPLVGHYSTEELLRMAAAFIGAAAIWGITNPFLKRGSESTAPVARKTGNRLLDGVLQLVAVLLNWRFSVPFALNQTGSLIYIWLLGSTEISMAVPIVNSLTFLFTALAAAALGEEQQWTARTYAGALCIVAGVALCVASKS
jgi:drug/metabolite transporter (DMT)-like permease